MICIEFCHQDIHISTVILLLQILFHWCRIFIEFSMRIFVDCNGYRQTILYFSSFKWKKECNFMLESIAQTNEEQRKIVSSLQIFILFLL